MMRIRTSAPGRARDLAAVALAVTSGATDAIGYLALGRVFTSAMTGNLVLLGIGLAHSNGERVGRVIVSLACFTVGCAVGARIAGTPSTGDPVWPRPVTRALAAEASVLLIYAGTWWMGERSDVVVKAALLGIGALALGIQSAAIPRFGVASLSTTFLSGALMRLVGVLVTGRPRDGARYVVVLIALVTGGLLAAVLVLHAPSWAPIIQLVPLAVAIGLAVNTSKEACHVVSPT